MVEQALRAALLLLHVLAAAAWFGSIFYSIFVLYPRLMRHFADIAERERFLLTLSHGAFAHELPPSHSPRSVVWLATGVTRKSSSLRATRPSLGIVKSLTCKISL